MQAPASDVLNSGAKLGPDNKWYIGDVELVFASICEQDAPDILRSVEILERVQAHFDLPPPLAYVSNVSALVYLSWLDLETIASHFQDPHIQQYAGTWSRVTFSLLRCILADETWRPDSRRRPISQGLCPGWDRWRSGKPLPWHELSGTFVAA